MTTNRNVYSERRDLRNVLDKGLRVSPIEPEQNRYTRSPALEIP